MVGSYEWLCMGSGYEWWAVMSGYEWLCMGSGYEWWAVMSGYATVQCIDPLPVIDSPVIQMIDQLKCAVCLVMCCRCETLVVNVSVVTATIFCNLICFVCITIATLRR